MNRRSFVKFAAIATVSAITAPLALCKEKLPTFDRVGIRRVIVFVKRDITQIVKQFVFEPCDETTRKNIEVAIKERLNFYKKTKAIHSFYVVIEKPKSNSVDGTVYLKKAKNSEFIVLDFTIAQS